MISQQYQVQTATPLVSPEPLKQKCLETTVHRYLMRLIKDTLYRRRRRAETRTAAAASAKRVRLH